MNTCVCVGDGEFLALVFSGSIMLPVLSGFTTVITVLPLPELFTEAACITGAVVALAGLVTVF